MWGENNPHFPKKFTEDHYNELVDAMLKVLSAYGLVEPIEISVSSWRITPCFTTQNSSAGVRELPRRSSGARG